MMVINTYGLYYFSSFIVMSVCCHNMLEVPVMLDKAGLAVFVCWFACDV